MVLILLYIIPASPAYPMKKLQDLSFSMINLSEISLITEQGILVVWVQFTSPELPCLWLLAAKPSCRYCRLPEL